MKSNKTFDEMRVIIGAWLKGPHGDRLWDLMCALRGPDFPSETPLMSSDEGARTYAARRNRKYKTTEIVREKAFFGVCGGCARHHDDDHVYLPPEKERDHFDKHIERVADMLGLGVEIEKVMVPLVEVKYRERKRVVLDSAEVHALGKAELLVPPHYVQELNQLIGKHEWIKYD